jgi:hypothetical protein
MITVAHSTRTNLTGVGSVLLRTSALPTPHQAGEGYGQGAEWSIFYLIKKSSSS